MKKSELKAVIKEYYKEVLLEAISPAANKFVSALEKTVKFYKNRVSKETDADIKSTLTSDLNKYEKALSIAKNNPAAGYKAWRNMDTELRDVIIDYISKKDLDTFAREL